MQVKRRLKITAVITAGATFLLLLVLFLSLYHINKANDLAKIAGDLMLNSLERVTLRNDYLRNDNERAKKQWFDKHQQIYGLLTSASGTFRDAEDKETIDELLEEQASTQRLFTSIVLNREKRGGRPDADGLARETEDRLLSQLNMRVYDEVMHVRTLLESSREARSSALRKAAGGIILVLAIIVATALFHSWTMGRTITDRIGRLRAGAAVIGGGNLDYRIDMKGNDEFAELSETFNAMTAKLRGSYHDLENEIEERKRVQEALHEAHNALEARVQERTKELQELNETLEQRVAARTADIQAANEALHSSRLASLNLMEDAVTARKQAEDTSADLARAFEQRQKSNQRLAILSETAGALLASDRPQELVSGLCRKVMEYLDCHAFFNFLVDEQAGRLRLNACGGIPEEEARRIEWLDYGVAVCGCAARDNCRIVAEYLPTTSDERTELVKSYGIKAYACHPLLGLGGKVIGTLSFGTRNRETFSEEDLSLMKAVTDQVAVAMTRMATERALRLRGEELQAANRDLEAFIYSVSHDLRTPMRSMAVFTKLIADGYVDRLDDKGRDYFRRVTDAGVRMNRLVEDLLYLSRVSRQEIKRTRFDLSDMASHIVSELREASPGRKVEVEIESDISVFADPQLIELVLANLLGNAWKFTSKTDEARISFGEREGEGAIEYYVSDNGAGFDPEYAGKMFHPFQRLHSEGEFEGTGIGLAIVEQAIRRHGGKVRAEGDIGKGATVFFTLA